MTQTGDGKCTPKILLQFNPSVKKIYVHVCVCHKLITLYFALPRFVLTTSKQDNRNLLEKSSQNPMLRYPWLDCLPWITHYTMTTQECNMHWYMLLRDGAAPIQTLITDTVHKLGYKDQNVNLNYYLSLNHLDIVYYSIYFHSYPPSMTQDKQVKFKFYTLDVGYICSALSTNTEISKNFLS
jgi:hypothetical protein